MSAPPSVYLKIWIEVNEGEMIQTTQMIQYKDIYFKSHLSGLCSYPDIKMPQGRAPFL